MTTVTINNQAVDFDGAVALMDDDLREAVHSAFIEGTEQDFADMYAAAHKARFGSVFAVN